MGTLASRLRVWARTRVRRFLLRILAAVDGPAWSPVVRVRLKGWKKPLVHHGVKRVDYRPLPGGNDLHAVLVDSYGNETLYLLSEVVELRRVERLTERPQLKPMQVVFG